MEQKKERVPQLTGAITRRLHRKRRLRYDNNGRSGFSILPTHLEGVSPDYDHTRPKAGLITGVIEQIVRIGIILFAFAAVFDVIYGKNLEMMKYMQYVLNATENKVITGLATAYLYQFPFVLLLAVIIVAGMMNLRGHHFKEAAKQTELTVLKYLAVYAALMYVGYEWFTFATELGHLQNSLINRLFNQLNFLPVLGVFIASLVVGYFDSKSRLVAYTIAIVSGLTLTVRAVPYAWDGIEWFLVYALKLSGF